MTQTTENLQLQPGDVEAHLKGDETLQSTRTRPELWRPPESLQPSISWCLQLTVQSCLVEHFIPTIWGSSIICPVAKRNNPKFSNYYGSVALTSLVMKIFENLVVAQLQADTCMHADPFNVHTGSRGGGGGGFGKKPRFHVRVVFCGLLKCL